MRDLEKNADGSRSLGGIMQGSSPVITQTARQPIQYVLKMALDQ